jgi:hypothetical protein
LGFLFSMLADWFLSCHQIWNVYMLIVRSSLISIQVNRLHCKYGVLLSTSEDISPGGVSLVLILIAELWTWMSRKWFQNGWRVLRESMGNLILCGLWLALYSRYVYRAWGKKESVTLLCNQCG